MRNVFWVLVVVAVLLGPSCSSRLGSPRDAAQPFDGGSDAAVAIDTGPADTGASDTGPSDTGASDAGRDAGAMDAGHDAAVAIDAGHDAGHDAGTDAPIPDTGPRPDGGRCPGGARIGLYAADDMGAHTDVHDFLVGTAVLGSVTIGGPVEDMAGPPPIPARIPTLGELMAYDALFVWGSGAWNGDAFGNVLADYVDAGGGVVITTYAQRSGSVVGVGGRMLSAGYLPYVPASYTFAPRSLGVVTMPAHPIMLGVTTVTGSNIANHEGAIAAGATLIASWADTTPLIATLAPSNGRTVLVGMYPHLFWDRASNGARLIANALLWSAHCN